MAEKKSETASYIKQLNDLLELYLVKKAPALPKNIKEAIVKFGPWITLILIVLALPLLLAVFGLGTILLPFSFLGGVSAGYKATLGLLFSGITVLLEIVALPGLFKRAKAGWNLVYYAALIGAIEHVLTFNIGGLIIGTLLSLYILFQVKEYYK